MIAAHVSRERLGLVLIQPTEHNLANNRTIVLLDAAAQSIDEKPLGEGLNEQIPIAHQDLAQARGPIELGTVWQNPRSVNRPRPWPGRVAPPAKTVEILERKA